MLNANLIYMLNNKYKNKNKIEYFMKLRVFKKNIKKKILWFHPLIMVIK